MNELLRKLLFLPEQGSELAAEIDGLHYFVILTTMLGAGVVTVVGGYFIVRYRRGRYGHGDDEYQQSRLSEPTKPLPLWLEIAVISGLLALFLSWWVIGFRQYVKARVAPEHAEQIYVVGKKWMWHFAYPDGGGSISVLYVPAGRPVQLVLTSRDVIHSFFVPEFRIKQDAVPGRYTTAWFEASKPGVYDIFCTEYCGAGHSTMRGQVVALSPDDYERWLEGPRESVLPGQEYRPPAVVGEAPEQPVDLVAQGRKQAAEQGCLRCHTSDGSPHIGPTFAGMYGARVPLEEGGEVVADEAYLTESMMDPQKRVHAGFRPVMPAYLGLGPGETAAILEYIKSLRDVPRQPVEQRSYP